MIRRFLSPTVFSPFLHLYLPRSSHHPFFDHSYYFSKVQLFYFVIAIHYCIQSCQISNSPLCPLLACSFFKYYVSIHDSHSSTLVPVKTYKSYMFFAFDVSFLYKNVLCKKPNRIDTSFTLFATCLHFTASYFSCLIYLFILVQFSLLWLCLTCFLLQCSSNLS